MQPPRRQSQKRRPTSRPTLPLSILGGLLLASSAARAYHLPAGSRISREALLRSGGAAAAAAAAGFLRTPVGIARAENDGRAPPPPPAPAAGASKLYDRFFQDDIKNPGIAGFGSPTLLFLPPWMLGEWDATMTFDSYKFPLGEDYVPPQILRSVNAKAVDQAPTSFKLRFYSTLPSTTENTLRVSLGQLPKSEVVPDRVFNTRSVLDAYYGYPAAAQIDYDIEKSPLRMQIEFTTVGRDMQPLPKRRQQLFLNNLQYDCPDPSRLYVSSEFIRTVTLSQSRNGVTVSDTETLTLYELQPDGRSVKGRQRVGVYLTPNPNNKEGTLFFETGGRAVALFDYSFTMVKSGDCVVTPKGVEQCVGPDGGASYRVVGGGDEEGEEEDD